MSPADLKITAKQLATHTFVFSLKSVCIYLSVFIPCSVLLSLLPTPFQLLCDLASHYKKHPGPRPPAPCPRPPAPGPPSPSCYGPILHSAHSQASSSSTPALPTLSVSTHRSSPTLPPWSMTWSRPLCPCVAWLLTLATNPERFTQGEGESWLMVLEFQSTARWSPCLGPPMGEPDAMAGACSERNHSSHGLGV